jgi:hypothetical protein
MAKFRKKPVVVDAFQWTGSNEQAEDPEWIVEAIHDGTVWFIDTCTPRVKVAIRTLEGVMIAAPGDWIIRGVKGELYPCRPDIFEATYEQVE